MLVLSRHAREAIIIDENIRVVVVDIIGDRVRLGIEAPKNISVHREEIFLSIPDTPKEVKNEWSYTTNFYSSKKCPKCHRARLLTCLNGKTRCEGCNWVVEDKDYAPISRH